MLGSKNKICVKLCVNRFRFAPHVKFWFERVHERVIGEYRAENSGTFFVTHQRTDANANADVATLNLKKQEIDWDQLQGGLYLLIMKGFGGIAKTNFLFLCYS